MVRQQTGERSMEDVQDLLEEGASFLPDDCSTCLHDRPFFHTLLPDIDSATASQESVESLPHSGDGLESGRQCTSTESQSDDDSFFYGKCEEDCGETKHDDDGMEQVMSLDDLMDSE